MIKVEVSQEVQELVGGEAEMEVEANVLGQLVEELDQRYPGFRQSILNAMGNIRSSILVYIVRGTIQDRSEMKPGFTYQSGGRLPPGYRVLEQIEDLRRELPDGATIVFDLRQIAGG